MPFLLTACGGEDEPSGTSTGGSSRPDQRRGGASAVGVDGGGTTAVSALRKVDLTSLGFKGPAPGAGDAPFVPVVAVPSETVCKDFTGLFPSVDGKDGTRIRSAGPAAAAQTSASYFTVGPVAATAFEVATVLDEAAAACGDVKVIKRTDTPQKGSYQVRMEYTVPAGTLRVGVRRKATDHVSLTWLTPLADGTLVVSQDFLASAMFGDDRLLPVIAKVIGEAGAA